jgi:stage V sporulation protein G
MEITEVRIKLVEEPGEKLKAFCSITLDNCFVVRDLKIIEGANGLFVAMPSRRLTAHCPHCRTKNHLRACYCNQCGARLREPPIPRDAEGRERLYADIAHPINSACREMIQRKVIEAFYQERIRASQPGYVSRYEDYEEGQFEADTPQATKPSREGTSGAAGGKVPHAGPPQGPHTRSAGSTASSPRSNASAEGG